MMKDSRERFVEHGAERSHAIPHLIDNEPRTESCRRSEALRVVKARPF